MYWWGCFAGFSILMYKMIFELPKNPHKDQMNPFIVCVLSVLLLLSSWFYVFIWILNGIFNSRKVEK